MMMIMIMMMDTDVHQHLHRHCPLVWMSMDYEMITQEHDDHQQSHDDYDDDLFFIFK